MCVCVCPCEKLPLHPCPPLHLCGLKYSLFHHILSSICPLDCPHKLYNLGFSFYSSLALHALGNLFIYLFILFKTEYFKTSHKCCSMSVPPFNPCPPFCYLPERQCFSHLSKTVMLLQVYSCLLIHTLLWNVPRCYHYTVIVPTTLNPSLSRPFVACWSFPNRFSVCAMLTNCFQALKCVKLCITQTWHTRVWEDRGTKALRPVTFRSRHVSEVSQVINNCGWSSRPAPAQYQAATSSDFYYFKWFMNVSCWWENTFWSC